MLCVNKVPSSIPFYKIKMFVPRLLVYIIAVFSTSSAIIDLQYVSDKMNALTADEEMARWSRQIEAIAWNWQNHERGSGAGNREELSVTNIEIYREQNLHMGIKDWQFLKHEGEIYLAGTIESTFFLYHFNIHLTRVYFYASFSVPEKITSYRIFNLMNNVGTPTENDSICLILSVEANDKVQYLKWFHLINGSFSQFWTWKLSNPIKSLEYLYFNNQHKLFVLYENDVFFNKNYSSVAIYAITISGESSTFRLCNQLYVPEAHHFKVCPPRDDRTSISLLGKDHVILYEYKDENFDKCIFKEVQNITIIGVTNVECFESGYMHYLTTSGFISNLFQFQSNEFIFDQGMGTLFRELGTVTAIKSLSIDSYKDEVLLLAQLKNGTIVAFSWESLKFKLISLPNNRLDQYDLSTVTMIPNFGFVSGNMFIKFKFKTNQVSKNREDQIHNILETKSILTDLLEKQESIIIKTNLMIENSYMNHSELQTPLNIEEAEIDELTINETNNFYIKYGLQNITLQEMQSNLENVLNIIEKFETKINIINNIIKSTIFNNDTETNLQGIDVTGTLKIKGTLTVQNLTINNLNKISMNTLMKECLKDENIRISGIKSFPTIQFTEDNLKLKKLNGIKLKEIDFDDFNKDYNNIDLSKVTKLEIKENLNFSKINGKDWNDLLQHLIFKNKKKIIPGVTAIAGEMKAGYIRMDYLNDLKYPSDYVVKSGPEDAQMTSEKFFETLKVTDLQDLKTINGIEADEFITLNEDQTLEHLITFEHLVIDESLQIDGDIYGLPKQDFDPDITLLNSNIIHSSASFTNLYVLGKIYVEHEVNGTEWSQLDDLIFKNEVNVSITGKKIFLNNVHIDNSLEIKTGIINGHSVRDFVTINTRQILPNLSRIFGNITFSKVSYEELQNFEDEINANVGSDGLPICMKKQFIFIEAPVVDYFSPTYINENVTGFNFLQKLQFLLKNVYFEHLNVKNLIIENLVPNFINNINYQEFKRSRISKTRNQNLSGNISIQYLEVTKLNSSLVNNRSADDLKHLISKINTFYTDIFNGKTYVDTLNVTGLIRTRKISQVDLNNALGINDVEQFICRTNEYIENIIVDGLINGLNFTTKIYDTVLKTESRVVLKGPKKLKKLISDDLNVDYINSHAVDDIVSANKNQTISGPVKIKGSVIVQNKFNCNSNVNNIVFEEMNRVIQKLSDNLYKLTGNFSVLDKVVLKDLNMFGCIQHKNIDEFFENLIFLDDKYITITGSKTIKNVANFLSNVTVVENFNELDLGFFYENVVLVDSPISISSKIIFENDVLLEGDLVVLDNLNVNTICDININDLMENAVYLNRPTFIAENAVFSNVIFKSDITVETWNNVTMEKLFTLNNDESIRSTLMCFDILVDKLEIQGLINGENMTELYTNTFTLSTNQYISGVFSFFNNVSVRNDLNSRFINGIDISKIIPLNDSGSLNGNFVFKNPVLIRGNLHVFQSINGINITKWESIVIKINSTNKQTIFGKWTVYGNVTFNRNVNSSGFINGINVQKFKNDIIKQKNKIDSQISDKMKNLKSMCEDLQELQNKTETMVYKFRSFEYLKMLQFDQNIASVYHFELNNTDYIMVNFESCYLSVFLYTNERFILNANVSNFGYVKQYITLNYENNLYFVTVGKSECGRQSGNLWSFEDNQFKHLLNLGNVTDAEKLGDDAFALVVDRQVQEWSVARIKNNLFEPVNVIPLKDKNVNFFSNENDTLLASQDSIYDLPSEAQEFQEYENPFNTNEIFSFKAGLLQKEFILFHDNRISSDYIFICNNNLTQRKVLQTINSQKPSSFTILNFNDFEETLLIYSENKRAFQIYEYAGIEGFKHHSRVKIKINKMFNFQLRIYPYSLKQHCLAIVEDNKLTILVAKMYGERLNSNNQLICNSV